MATLMAMPDSEPHPDTANSSRVPNQFVTFTCGNRIFGIDIMAVREIRSWAPTTPMPNQPFGAQGVLDIRGSIVEVYDLAVMLGAAGSDVEAGKVILVASLVGRDVGIIADTVSDIIFAKPEDLRPTPSKGNGHRESCVSTLVKNEDRLVAILDLPALFPDQTVQ